MPDLPPPLAPAAPAGAFRLIGKATPRIDGAKIVTGKARYTHDLYFADMLHGKVLRSPHAAAEIVSIDLGPALALPEVKERFANGGVTAAASKTPDNFISSHGNGRLELGVELLFIDVLPVGCQR